MSANHHETCGICHTSGPCPHTIAKLTEKFKAVTADRRETGAPPALRGTSDAEIDALNASIDHSTTRGASDQELDAANAQIRAALSRAPVAGSASFSELLNDWRTEIIYGCHEGDYYGGTERARAARARVESLHRDEVERLTTALRLALRVAESWVHDQLDGTSMLHDALAELDPARAALPGHADDAATSGDHPNSSNEEG